MTDKAGLPEIRAMVNEFFCEFREFKCDLDRHMAEMGELLCYVILPQVFHDHIEEILRANDEKEWINRFFGFLERMAAAHPAVQDLLSLAFLDNMRDDPAVLEVAKTYCGSHTAAHLDNLLRSYGPDARSARP